MICQFDACIRCLTFGFYEDTYCNKYVVNKLVWVSPKLYENGNESIYVFDLALGFLLFSHVVYVLTFNFFMFCVQW